jgi:predicted O-methyltransferase YrrM
MADTGDSIYDAPLNDAQPISEIPWSSDYALRLLFHTVRQLQPETVVEMGASVGVSTAYLAAGVACNGAGQVTTHEGMPSYAALSEGTLRDLGLQDHASIRTGLFQETIPETLATSGETIDLAYIDGNHRYDPTWEYFTLFREHCQDGTMLVFDDIRWSDEMARVWDDIKAADGFTALAEVTGIGIGVLDSDGSNASLIRLPKPRLSAG